MNNKRWEQEPESPTLNRVVDIYPVSSIIVDRDGASPANRNVAYRNGGFKQGCKSELGI